MSKSGEVECLELVVENVAMQRDKLLIERQSHLDTIAALSKALEDILHQDGYRLSEKFNDAARAALALVQK